VAEAISAVDILKSVEPRSHRKVIDLVHEAGVNVDDWVNFKKGPNNERAASNPKYCYDWAFVEQGKVVVLNLWFDSMRLNGDAITQSVNPRRFGEEVGKIKSATWAMRATRMDLAIQKAYREKLPIRVVVCQGDMRTAEDPDAEPSHVYKRLLDPEPWAISSYDFFTGECLITRGAEPDRYSDQFDEIAAPAVAQKDANGKVYVRDPAVRALVLLRAKGKCEFCGVDGFLKYDGKVYLETHHIVPLSEGGPDHVRNVIALCPNHHREAHFSNKRAVLRADLQMIVATRLTVGTNA
jgi:5-methylcytosine-specific restriction enzyme A